MVTRIASPRAHLGRRSADLAQRILMAVAQDYESDPSVWVRAVAVALGILTGEHRAALGVIYPTITMAAEGTILSGRATVFQCLREADEAP